MKKLFFSIFFVSFTFTLFAQSVSPLVFDTNLDRETKWLLHQNGDESMYRIITNEAFSLLQERNEKIEKLQTKADWIKYQDKLKDVFRKPVDIFEKTPLNSRVTGILHRDGFMVEKIIFESHPGFYVTGCLFLPQKRQNPAPAVIYCSGHSPQGFRSDIYQLIILNLVKKGFIVFAFDPIGQGERLQYLDNETAASKIGGPTTEHSYAGAQTLLTGTSLYAYFIWDGVRAIDYLATRKEVDMNRIGIAGRSGGGTQSAMISAYDDRIYAAAPECYITNFKRLLESKGPQDAEQNPHLAIANGFDHADFFHIRAPKPSIIVTTTNDFFNQQGALETFAEAKKSYKAMKHAEDMHFSVDFGVHESTKKNRERVYAFFQKYLNLPGDSTDHNIEIFPEKELWVTPTGQVGNSFKGETVFSLNKKYFAKKEVPENELKAKIKQLSGIQFNRKFTGEVFTGKIMGEGFDINKYFLETDKNDFYLPFYLIQKPNAKNKKILVWLPANGKQNLLNNQLIKGLLAKDYTIIAADLPDIGELHDAEFSGDGFVKQVPFNYTFGASLIGKSITGIQAEALDILMQFVDRKFNGIEKYALAENGLNQPLLHYAIFKNSFSKIILQNPLVSNLTLILTEYYDPKLAYNVVPGSLPYYDFNDLVDLLPANTVKIIHPVNAKGEKSEPEINSNDMLMKLLCDYEFP